MVITEVGYDVPAQIGMSEAEIETPALIVDLDKFENNLIKMRNIIEKTVLNSAHMQKHISP